MPYNLAKNTRTRERVSRRTYWLTSSHETVHLARETVHPSHESPDILWAGFIGLDWIERRVGHLFRQFPHYLEVVWRGYPCFSGRRRDGGIPRVRDPIIPVNFPL